MNQLRKGSVCRLRIGRYSESGQVYLVTTVTRQRQAVFADFAAALNQMLAHPQLREFGAAGRKRVEEHFSWDSIAEQTIGVYQRAIAGNL